MERAGAERVALADVRAQLDDAPMLNAARDAGLVTTETQS